MHATETAQRVRIYVNEADMVGTRPRYLAALELLRDAGATSAVALRGMAGFGLGQPLKLNDTSKNMPVVIEWVDRAERVARVLPSLDELLPDALITTESVQIYRATLRNNGPFGEHSVGELAQTDIAAVAITGSLADAARVLAEQQLGFVPVLGGQGQLVGLVTAAALARRGIGSLASLRAAAPAEREAQFAALADIPLATGADTEPLSIGADASVVQAAKAMIEWGQASVPVVRRGGQFVGAFGVEQALRAVLDARPAPGGVIREANPPAPIGLLMQGAFQTVLAYAMASEGLERLRNAGAAPLIAVDNGRPVGLLDPARIDALPIAELQALAEKRVASLPLMTLPAMPTTSGYDQAIEVLLAANVPWIAAVDEDGRLQGLVGPLTVLRALVQESEG